MNRPQPVADLDWGAGEARELTGAVLDLWCDMLDRMRELPVAPPLDAAAVARAAAVPIPAQPMPVAELAALLRPLVMEHSTLCGHPGFMAYISGSGTVPGAAADLLAAALNPNAGGWTISPAATELELHLTRWLAGRFGLPNGAAGLMTSGGAASNLTALKAARDARTPGDTRRDGIAGLPLVLYASEEAHATIAEAADVMGLGERAVRAIPTDAGLRMRADALEQTIADDRAAGRHPFAVVATAGTTATGAIDPLPAVADICAAHGLWMHVDAAYGGAAVLAPELRPLLAGIEQADSIAFDPHKWLYTPQSSACLLVRDPAHLLRSFSIDAAYVRDDAALSGRGTNVGEMGPQWSRAFLALKVWLSLAAHGTEAYGRRIAHDVELARYLDARVREHPDLEPMCPVTLSIACFRYAPAGAGLDDQALDALNERLMVAIRRDGRAFPSNAVLGGRYGLRACLVNHRTEAQDIDALLDATLELGAALVESGLETA
ncbi:MAG TPA: aminotransferase class V-fold PLP-dependent enzyme [Gaiellales bacterium]